MEVIPFFRASQRLAAVVVAQLLLLIKTVQMAAVAAVELAITRRVQAVRLRVGRAVTVVLHRRQHKALRAAVVLGRLARIAQGIMALMAELVRRHLSPDHLLRAAVVVAVAVIQQLVRAARVELVVVAMARGEAAQQQEQLIQAAAVAVVMELLEQHATARTAVRVW